jgi:predicted O-linked N-acetylglucosamine transferase (SPINDLY family)
MTDRLHTEALVRLPSTQWCWRPFVSPPHSQQPPCLERGAITFGSFHGAMKLSPGARRLWREILARVPGSRFVAVGVPQGVTTDALVRDLGVGASRVTVVPYVSMDDYMRWYDAVDIILDPLPYSGANTTCDALYMGVPVLTVPGDRTASRSAASVLSAVGLDEWIAPSRDEYVRRAVDFSGRREDLVRLRGTLRSRLQSSPLMDEHGFVRHLEAAYRRMWRRWCGGEPAQAG